MWYIVNHAVITVTQRVRVSCVLIMNKGEYYNCHAKPVMNVDNWLLGYYVTEYPTNVHTLHTNNNYWVS